MTDRHGQRHAKLGRRTTLMGVCLAVALLSGGGGLEGQVSLDSLSARIDPFVEKPRVLVLTDIANEPDDQMSLVRFLVYSNEYDVEGLVATTSRRLRKRAGFRRCRTTSWPGPAGRTPRPKPLTTSR